jgi:Spy/CpxP family protein refolding chaperone
MRKFTTTFLLASTLVAGAMAVPSLSAQGSQERSGSMMDHGMMGDKNTNDKGGMMGMMKQMSEMMDHCNSMMSDGRPNDQWRRNRPSTPNKGG